MRRVSGWLVMLMLVLAWAPTTRADYEAGQRAWDAGEPAEALRLWQTAADAGDARAMLALARLYAQGLGAPQNYIEAHKWFNLAASRGEAAAPEERDALAAKMTPQQVALAQERAAAWQPGTSPAAPGTVDAPAAVPDVPAWAIREVQQLLVALGYEPGPADGVWDEGTARAYQSYLRDAGRSESDMLTPEVLGAMREAAGQRGEAVASAGAVPGQEPGSSVSADVGGLLESVEALLGLERSERRLIQMGLKREGFDPGSADGLFGRGTRRAIGRWQALRGEETTGYLDGESAKVLLASGREQESQEAARLRREQDAQERARREAVSRQPIGPKWAIVENQPCQMYNQALKPGDVFTVTWSGACLNGKASGNGRLVWQYNDANGIYEGWIRDGKFNGQGVMTFAVGSRYEGNYRDNEIHGHGIFTWGDGRRYKGQWRGGKPHGQGVMTFADGSRYEGQWRDGCFGERDGRWMNVMTSAEACGFK